ncbi:MAG: alpha-hydroxy acid oxidase, partial [Acidimicrobiales bacterium]
VWDFVDGGADGELAVAANRQALDDVLFSPRFLVDVAERDMTTTVFGEPVSLPLVLSPSGLATVVHPDGEPAVAAAAAEAGAIFAVSTASGYSMEEIAEASTGRLWFQLYLWKSEDVVQSLITRAENAGYEALVVTIDVPVVGKRERDLRNGMSLPVRVRPSSAANASTRLPWVYRMLNGPEITFASLAGLAPGDDASSIGEYTNRELTDPARTWQDLAMIRRRWNGPLLVKGVMNRFDAQAAVENGADGIIVSNHGGRQISSVPGVAAVLPEVVEAVGDRAEVFLDGGVRRGEDIVKARALGATAACGGRLWFWGLAAGGEAGVSRVLSILAADVDRTLALIGTRRFDDVGPDALYEPSNSTAARGGSQS